ncbi:Cholesterol side-chain cleavage enzyme, mitochondrial [Balamuthia mandrillaris]
MRRGLPTTVRFASTARPVFSPQRRLPSYRHSAPALSTSAFSFSSRSQASACFRPSSASFQHAATVSASASSPTEADQQPQPQQQAKPWEEIPGPKGYPILGNLLEFAAFPGGFHKIHEKIAELVASYGPLVRYEMMGQKAVLVTDADDSAAIHRAAGRYPVRAPVLPWKLYREHSKIFPGVVNLNGEPWANGRRVLNEKLLRPPAVENYVPEVAKVAIDLVELMKQSRDATGYIPDIENILFRFGMEAIGTVIFDARVGSLVPNPEPQVKEFVKAVGSMFSATQELMYGFPLYQWVSTPAWKRMVAHWDTIMKVGQVYVDRKMADIDKTIAEKGEEALQDSHSFLTFLLTKEGVTPEEVNVNCIDLLAGGVDTTSYTLLWALYELSRHPEAQALLQKEVDEVLKGEKPNAETLKHLPIVKGCIREALRMHPVAFMIPRILDNEIELRGYRIPAGVQLNMVTKTMGLDEKYFPKATEFHPERYLNDDYHPYASLPFGFGPRMCIGRRVAEMEMYVTLAHMVQNFSFSYAGEQPAEEILNMLLVPKEHVKLRFTDRKAPQQ